MDGPRPAGTWTARGLAKSHRWLCCGQRYRVIQAFVDYDRTLHPVGETWTFLGHSFVPYDDGMSFFVSLDGRQEWLIRLKWDSTQQGDVLDALDAYFALI